jgi:hypothetical protein
MGDVLSTHSKMMNYPSLACYVFDEQVVARAYDAYLIQKQVADIVFCLLDSDMRIRMHAQSLSVEIQSSLEIEGESIAYESVFSSICRKLDVHLEQSAKSDRYADSIASLALAYHAYGVQAPLQPTESFCRRVVRRVLDPPCRDTEDVVCHSRSRFSHHHNESRVGQEAAACPG